MALKILHCVEFYHPSPGGAQAVVRQVSRELVLRGHEVTVATTRLPHRQEAELDGARIEEFEISGNAVRGMTGEVERYRSFVFDGGFDLVMTYAAQQWTTDALLPVLDRIPGRKVLAPCGFSGLDDPAYQAYYSELPGQLVGFDELIFHSDTYQDIEFARRAGLENLNVVPNGASREEFEDLASDFREQHRIDFDEPLLLTVGPHNWIKGHAQAVESFGRSNLTRGAMVVIGNKPLRLGCQWDCRRRSITTRLASRGRKRVILLDVPRDQVLAAYRAADLFVFCSEVECSPLVLFEAAASATPFVSTAAGNAVEIADWTGAGIIVPSERRDGRVTAPTERVAAEIESLWKDGEERLRRAEQGRAAWRREFTWDQLAARYERVYTGS